MVALLVVGAPGIDAQEEVATFGGPSSVNAQIRSDREVKQTPFRFTGLSGQMQPYYDFQARIKQENGLAFGADYNALYQHASDSPGEDDAAGGVIRLFANWTMTGRGTPRTGSLVAKVENRHRLGTDIAPQDLAGEIGYVGLTAIVHSDADTLLTNLYWQQNFGASGWAFVAGFVDTTDYVDIYGLANPWTTFSNLTFSTNPVIPVPNQGLGVAASYHFAENYYVFGGFADTNGDPGDPLEGLDTFFDDSEFFKHIEFGWTPDWGNRYEENVHLTLWQVDEREEAAVDDGWGAAFSFSRKLGDRWLPFFRAGYSDGGGGSFLQRSASVGVGYFPEHRSDNFGIGLGWGEPSDGTFGRGLDDQYTIEAYYRIQLFQHMTVTPQLQYLIDPPQNPQEDRIWVLGLRTRISL